MSKQKTIGDIAVTGFILVQLIDWIATYQGLTLFGTSIEGNPLLRFLMERYDIILVLTAVKIFATIAGSFLHFVHRHSLVAALTLLYTFFAIIPWMRMSGPYTVLIGSSVSTSSAKPIRITDLPCAKAPMPAKGLAKASVALDAILRNRRLRIVSSLVLSWHC